MRGKVLIISLVWVNWLIKTNMNLDLIIFIINSVNTQDIQWT